MARQSQQITDRMVSGLAAKMPTPFWVYDAQAIERQIDHLRAFDVIRYAQKANSNLAVLQVMRRNGVLVDAVSNGEISRALAAGYPLGATDDQVVFTADILDRETLARVVADNVPVNCGSPDMLAQIGQAKPGHKVWLRINPGFGSGHSAKTNTGGPASKHGIWHENLAESLTLIDRYELDLLGLHMHIGSGVDYSHLENVCASMIDTVRQLARPISAISAGGGLSVPYTDDGSVVDTAHYFDLWDKARNAVSEICGRRVKLEIEPGRFLVAGAGKLVAEVRAVKPVADNFYTLVDAGFNELMRPAMYGAHHDIGFVDRGGIRRQGNPVDMAVGGPLCESGDIFTQADGGLVQFRSLPKPQVGDLAIFEDTGAYGATMSSNYNSRPLAAEFMIDHGQTSLIRRRQTVAELLALEKAEPFLL